MSLFISALSAALVGFLQLVELAHAAPAQHEVNVQGTYDFVVVGGGTAGNAVAARLGQRMPESTILVIEAGPSAPDEDRINIPGLKGSTLGTKYDWNFTSIPQPQQKSTRAQPYQTACYSSHRTQLQESAGRPRHRTPRRQSTRSRAWNVCPARACPARR